MRVLVTNDDGVGAPGLHALAKALVEAGHDVLAVAPLVDMSGSGAAIGHLGSGSHIVTRRVELPGLPRVPAYGVDGPPALAVLSARLGGFGDPPELVVSGINPGHNTGAAVLHSGTVGAALTAANFGASGLAVSTGDGGDGPPRWDTAGRLAVAALDWLASAPARTVINLNVPDLPLERVRGVRWAELARFGTVRSALVARGDDRLELELRDTGIDLPPGSDTALVLAGYAALCTLQTVSTGDWLPAAEQIERLALRRTA